MSNGRSRCTSLISANFGGRLSDRKCLFMNANSVCDHLLLSPTYEKHNSTSTIYVYKWVTKSGQQMRWGLNQGVFDHSHRHHVRVSSHEMQKFAALHNQDKTVVQTSCPTHEDVFTQFTKIHFISEKSVRCPHPTEPKLFYW